MDSKRISAIEAISFAGRSIVHHVRLFFFVMLAGSGLIALVAGLVGLVNKGLIQSLMNDPIFQGLQECVGRQCPTLVYQSGDQIIQLVSGNLVSLIVSFVALMLCFAGLDFGFKRIALDIYDRDESDVRQLFSQWKIIGKGFCAWALYCVIVWLGFMLFVIPGFIVLLRFAFFPFFMIDKNAGVVDSLKMSWEATRNHFWDIFACWFAVKIVSYVCFLSWIGVLLTWPVSTLAYAYVYRQLVVRNESILSKMFTASV
jgi:hypothetical protein